MRSLKALLAILLLWLPAGAMGSTFEVSVTGDGYLEDFSNTIDPPVSLGPATLSFTYDDAAFTLTNTYDLGSGWSGLEFTTAPVALSITAGGTPYTGPDFGGLSIFDYSFDQLNLQEPSTNLLMQWNDSSGSSFVGPLPTDFPTLNALAIAQVQTNPSLQLANGSVRLSRINGNLDLTLEIRNAVVTFTNLSPPDTDGDGLLDSVETGTGVWVDASNTGTDPSDDDSDDDGLLDGVESNTGTFVDTDDTGTDPNTTDTDGDGFADGPEVAFGADPTLQPNRPVVVMDLVRVGDAGNPADASGYGAVASDFLIGRHEVTNRQYAIFLNAVAAEDVLTLWNASMTGIQQIGAPGSHVYLVPSGFENRAVEWVSHWDAARFVNWLENDQPVGAQAAGTTETGTYGLSGASENGTGLSFRASDPGRFLPNEDQWYKAAYFAGGSSYETHPYQTSTPPTCTAPGATANTANCAQAVGSPTDVGAYTASMGRYGQFDQGGNVQEWVEYPGTGFAITRGGDWFSNVGELASGHRGLRVPYDASFNTGFRVAGFAPPTLGGSISTDNPDIPRKTCQFFGYAFEGDDWLYARSCVVGGDRRCSGQGYCDDGSACNDGETCPGSCAYNPGTACTVDQECPVDDWCDAQFCNVLDPVGVCETSGGSCDLWGFEECAYTGHCALDQKPCSSDSSCEPGDTCVPFVVQGFCWESGDSCTSDGDCNSNELDYCYIDPFDQVRYENCRTTTCEYSSDEDIPRYSWKYDDSGRLTSVIFDPLDVQDSVDVLDGLPFDPSQVGIGECLFDPATTFAAAAVAYQPLRYDGYQCCVWEAFCPSCSNTGGLFEFKWGTRETETPHHGDGDGLPTQCGDNCPFQDNPDQIDADHDGVGAACDPDDGDPAVPADTDGDGVRDPIDNCPDDYNPDQVDTDGDFEGNPCDATPVPEPGRALQIGFGLIGLLAMARSRGRGSKRRAGGLLR